VRPFSSDAVRRAYDTVATDYAAAFGDDLLHIEVDRSVLDDALALADDDGWVLEAGSGPAPAARYLGGRAANMLALDLSHEMLVVAGSRNPGLRRTQGDLRRLPLRDGCCSLVIAYYTLQHVHRSELPGVLGEIRRVLRPGGVLVVGTHLGDGDVYADEFLGHRISTMAGALHDRDELLSLLAHAGFRVDVERQRDALPHEYDSRRIYLIARLPRG
jgi:SAM-dependent methyltransferase